jgi:hypothetical protein
MTMTATPLLVLDPTEGPAEPGRAVAAGMSDLSGKRIGLLHNNKRGGQKFLDYLAEMIEERFDGVTFVRDRKLDVSMPCPPEILDRLVDKTDLLITAIGD